VNLFIAREPIIPRPARDEDLFPGYYQCYCRKRCGPYPSLDDTQEVCLIAVDLVRHVRRTLPCTSAEGPCGAVVALAFDYWLAQTLAEAIEELLNPREEPFASEVRELVFCLCWPDEDRRAARRHLVASLKAARTAEDRRVAEEALAAFDKKTEVPRAAARFLAAFDQVVCHYRWHEEVSLAEREKFTWRTQPGPYFTGPADTPQEPQPPPIDAKALRALARAADKLWTLTVQNLPRKLGPESQASLRKALLPDTAARVKGILVAHPDWSDQQIAREAGVSRGHLYRIEGYQEWRARSKAAAKADRKARTPRGHKYINKKTRMRECDGAVEDPPTEDDELIV
jgi:hypothetical protein